MSLVYAKEIDYIKDLIKHEIEAYDSNHRKAWQEGRTESRFYFEGGRDSLQWILKKIEEN